jgi:hypothetical protein
MRTWNRMGGLVVAAGVVLAMPALAADPQQIQQAIARGVRAIKEVPASESQDPRYRDGVGLYSLIGLTLLECGVPADDPAVRRHAELVQERSPQVTNTYSLALAILFLDRLGEEGDEILVQSMAVRLLGGQTQEGSWGYECPPLDEEERRRLSASLQRRAELRAGGQVPRLNPTENRPRPPLSPEIQNQMKRLEKPEAAPKNRSDMRKASLWGRPDHSNTQFAILGLWIARRHGVPVEKAVLRVERYFRANQNADGGWGYLRRDRSTPSMTCAGLLALAVAHGIAQESALRTAAAPKGSGPVASNRKPSGPENDVAVQRALRLLSASIGLPAALRNGKVAVISPRNQGHPYYYLWSLERVAVAFDLQTIGRKDWYAWGSEVALASQRADGMWQAPYGPHINTCFALLFLRRANLAKDLTASLRGKIKDPGEVALKSGGVGAAGLPNPAPPPGFNILEQPPEGAASNSSPKPAPPPDASQPAEADNQVARLHADLLKAPAGRQDKLLEQYKTSKGAEFTEAMARAIPDLPQSTRTKARDALAERLMRMTSATLREKLRDAHPEIRYAAARACATKGDYANFPALITLLNDPEPSVVRAARAALRYLADGRDFGPAPDAEPSTRAKALVQWEKWWKENGPARLQKANAGKGQ